MTTVSFNLIDRAYPGTGSSLNMSYSEQNGKIKADSNLDKTRLINFFGSTESHSFLFSVSGDNTICTEVEEGTAGAVVFTSSDLNSRLNDYMSGNDLSVDSANVNATNGRREPTDAEIENARILEENAHLPNNRRAAAPAAAPVAASATFPGEVTADMILARSRSAQSFLDGMVLDSSGSFYYSPTENSRPAITVQDVLIRQQNQGQGFIYEGNNMWASGFTGHTPHPQVDANGAYVHPPSPPGISEPASSTREQLAAKGYIPSLTGWHDPVTMREIDFGGRPFPEYQRF